LFFWFFSFISARNFWFCIFFLFPSLFPVLLLGNPIARFQPACTLFSFFFFSFPPPVCLNVSVISPFRCTQPSFLLLYAFVCLLVFFLSCFSVCLSFPPFPLSPWVQSVLVRFLYRLSIIPLFLFFYLPFQFDFVLKNF